MEGKQKSCKGCGSYISISKAICNNCHDALMSEEWEYEQELWESSHQNYDFDYGDVIY